MVREQRLQRLHELTEQISALEERFNRAGIWAPFTASQFARELAPLTEEVEQIRREEEDDEEDERREATRREEERKRGRVAEEQRKSREQAEEQGKIQTLSLLLKEAELKLRYSDERAEFFKEQAQKQAPSAPAQTTPTLTPTTLAPSTDQVVVAPAPVSVGTRAGEHREKAPVLSPLPAQAAAPGKDRPTGSIQRAVSAPTRTPTAAPGRMVEPGKAASAEPLRASTPPPSVQAVSRPDAPPAKEGMTGAEMSAWRKGRRMTQGDLATFLNTTQGNVSKVEAREAAAIPQEWVTRLSRET